MVKGKRMYETLKKMKSRAQWVVSHRVSASAERQKSTKIGAFFGVGGRSGKNDEIWENSGFGGCVKRALFCGPREALW